jgi:polynucleotide 5'-kinase involved in rRNA processing
MPNAQVGQRVQADISGLEGHGVSIASAEGKVHTKAAGVITDIDVAQRRITVLLDVAFNGQRSVVLSANRVEVIQ